MYRAKRLFEKQGFEVIHYNVDYKTVRNKKIAVLDLLPSAEYLKITEIGFKELLGRSFYLLKI